VTHSKNILKRLSLVSKWIATVVFILFLTGIAVAQENNSDNSDNKESPNHKDKKDDQSKQATVRLKILVLSDKDKPVGNASVYVRFNQSGGVFHHDKLVELNLKTNQDGSVKVPEIPQGQIMIQVIAPGWHTYGKWYDIEQDEDVVRINLAPPPHLY
jgi:hypothetical protein